MERRILHVAAQLRAEGQGDEMSLVGYAAKFGVLSHDLGNYREVIAPGAFQQSIANGDDVVCTFNHDTNCILGRTTSGTLKVAEDGTGLRFRCQLDPNQQWHRDLHAAVKRQDVGDCSFAFNCPDGGCDFSKRGTLEDGKTPCNIRTLRKVKLMDVAVVVSPAYPQTAVDARSIQNQIASFEAKKKQTIKNASKIASSYRGISLEDIARWRRMNYSEDTINALRLARITQEIRNGGGLEVGSMSPAAGGNRDGQAADPTQSLRTACGASTKFQHRAASQFHRREAQTEVDWLRTIKNQVAADAHAQAAFSGDSADSARARRASRALSDEDIAWPEAEQDEQ